jgi:hypothetical protein
MLAPNMTTEELRAAPAPSPGDAPIAWSPDMVAWLLMLVLFAVVFWFGFVASARALGRCGGRYVAVLTATAVIGAVYLYCFGNPAWQGLRLLDTWCLLWVAFVQWRRLRRQFASLMGWCAGRARAVFGGAVRLLTRARVPHTETRSRPIPATRK